MMNRRKFMATAGASAALLPVPSAFSLSNPGSPASTSHDTGRLRISLAGEWDRYFAGVIYDRIPVPSSRRPLGFYSLQRSFVLPRLSARQRAILHFDAVNYQANCQVTVFVSSHEAGPVQVEVSLAQGQSEVSHAEKSFRASSGLNDMGL